VEGSPAYQEAYELGKLLAARGWAVLTGGYIGTMEAVSRGASEAGGHVIGVTCDEIESWRPVGPNPWVAEEMRYPTLRERLYALIDHCDAALALPGGIGTLAEIAVMWAEIQVGREQPQPLICIGEGWKAIFSGLIQHHGDYIAEQDLALIDFAGTPAAAVELLDRRDS
jgi:uncharacterized protein (TIGR00730 family)